MSGAIAGTAILKTLEPSPTLKTITLTVNNKCNLKCPHCYLQYDKRNFVLTEPTIQSIFKSDFEHLAIVGKEPLLNKESIQLVEHLILKCNDLSRTVSLVTNGIGLSNIRRDVIKYIDYIDVSFDGGPKSYNRYRRGHFDKIIRSINSIQSETSIIFNGLHTLSTGNINEIEDMMNIQNYAEFNIIMFSPYLVTKNNGINFVSELKIEEILNQLKSSKTFINNNKAFLLIDTFHWTQDSLTYSDILKLINKLALEANVKVIEKDPINYGIIRVTFDDLVMTPAESLSPFNYSKYKLNASKLDLNKTYLELRENQLIESHGNKRTNFFL